MIQVLKCEKRNIPFGGKYDLLSALCGQSTTSGPNLLNAAVISSEKHKKLSIIQELLIFLLSLGEIKRDQLSTLKIKLCSS